MSRTFLVVAGIVVAGGAVLLAEVFRLRLEAATEYGRQAQLAAADARGVRERRLVPTEKKVPVGENFTAALERFGLSPEQSASASAAAGRAFNLRQVRAGNTITVNRSVAGELREIDYQIDADRMLRIVPAEGGFSAEVRDIPSKVETAAVTGRIEDSLFNAVEQQGETPELALRLAQIFGYDLDFSTDPRQGDTFRIILEKRRYANGQKAGYGRILAAEYASGGKKYQALLFHDPAGQPGYYNSEGRSLRKMFLRSPLKFGAPVTSHFSHARFHPILKTVRAHLGTDYGAPAGTPVESIGSGRVVFAGPKRGEGNMVHIVHGGGYETMYLHLSRLYVRPGEHLEIGKIIGLVGSTGLSTGPHLDFRILQSGQYKNFERLGLPPCDPVDKKHWPEFAELRERYLPLLKNPELLETSASSVASRPASGQ